MRVVLACDFFLKYTLALGQELERAGCDVTLLARDHGGEFGGDVDAMRAEIRRRLTARTDVHLLRGRVREPPHLRAAARVRCAVPGTGAVVHLQDGIVNDPRLPFAARARPGRFALTVHDPVAHPGDSQPGRRKRVARAALIRGAAVVFVHGEALRHEMREVTGVRAPIEVVPHGADPPRREPLPSRPSLLFFGRLSQYKGLDVLAEAMTEVWRALPRATLMVAGEGEPPRHPAFRDPRVTLRTEHIPEAAVAELFAGVTAVVLPYRQASQSGVGSQAKTHGRGMVVTDVGGLPELVADGSGLVVKAASPTHLAEGLIRVLSEPMLAERLGVQGARTVGRASSWRNVAALTLDAYRRHGLADG